MWQQNQRHLEIIEPEFRRSQFGGDEIGERQMQRRLKEMGSRRVLQLKTVSRKMAACTPAFVCVGGHCGCHCRPASRCEGNATPPSAQSAHATLRCKQAHMLPSQLQVTTDSLPILLNAVTAQ